MEFCKYPCESVTESVSNPKVCTLNRSTSSLNRVFFSPGCESLRGSFQRHPPEMSFHLPIATESGGNSKIPVSGFY